MRLIKRAVLVCGLFLSCAAGALMLGAPITTPAWSGPDATRSAVERDPAEAGIGRFVPVRDFVDVQGKTREVVRFADGVRGVAFIMTSTTCPLSKKYAPAIGRLLKEALANNVFFVVVDVQGGDTAKEFQTFATSFGLKGILAHDPERKIARDLGATTTTEVLLLDRNRTLVYRGAIDDQYGIGVAKDAPTKHWLRDAIRALKAGKRPAVQATTAPGCALPAAGLPKGESHATWNGSVSRIVQRHCMGCHRQGGIAPFPLETAKQVIAQSSMISWVLKEQLMPPWFAAEPEPGHSSPWANDRRIPDDERKALLAWLASDHPRGQPEAAPKAPTWPSGWTMGKPDVVFKIPRDVKVKAEGTMPYVHLKVPTNFETERWVRSWEVRPTARDVVHHVLVFVLEPGESLRSIREDSGFLAAFVPGNATTTYPEGFAKRIPKGATLYFQLHYTPNGKATVDRTSLGLSFLKGKPTQEVRTIGISNVRIRIPPGKADHVETALLPVLFDAGIMAFMPHMHYRGKSFRYDLLNAAGKRETLIDVPRYDFNWQLAYRYKKPRMVPAGSRIEVRAVFDNSADNPANPDPTKTVRWGLQSEDEMLIGYLEYYLPGIAPGTPLDGLDGERTRRGDAGRALLARGLIKRLDTDGDGKVSKAECPAWLRPGFKRADKNEDGFVDEQELTNVGR